MLRIAAMTVVRASGSSPTRGSSSSRIEARRTAARASITRRASPPDSEAPSSSRRRVDAVGEACEHGEEECRFGGGQDLGAAGVAVAEGDVVADRAAEQRELLGDVRESVAVAAELVVGDRRAADR